MREIPLTDILAEIEQGNPSEHNEILIKGDLILGYVNLPRDGSMICISCPIKITNSQFEGTVSLNQAIFQESVDFRGSVFKKDANFGGSVFRANADFGNATFEGRVSFNKSLFEDEVSFNRAIFLKNAGFSKSVFNKEVFFSKSIFKKDMSFNRSHFHGDAFFKSSKFHGNAYYRKAHFYQDADFSQSQFRGPIADFESASFQGNAFFYSATFKRGLILSRMKYERLYIRWKNLTRPRFQQKYLQNLDRISNLAYSRGNEETAYLLLIENFKRLGFFEDADNCYYHYRNERRQELPPLYKPIDWILMVSYGYGARPVRPLILSVIFFLAFAVLYSIYGYLPDTSQTIAPAEAVNLSLTLLLSGSKLIEDPNSAATGTLYFIFTLEKLIGSFFFALFLISIGRTIIR